MRGSDFDETPVDDEEEKYRKSFLKQLCFVLFLLLLGLVYVFYGQTIVAWGEQKLAELEIAMEQSTEPEMVAIYPTPVSIDPLPTSPEVLVVGDFLPITNEKHVENCETSSFVSNVTLETANTEIFGIQGDDFEHYTLYINMPGYGIYAIEFEATKDFLGFKVLESNITNPVYENFWEYDFRGETFAADLPNGDTAYLYIPWPDGYPNQYLYYVGSSVEEVCGN